jgi:hypothetical protein
MPPLRSTVSMPLAGWIGVSKVTVALRLQAA